MRRPAYSFCEPVWAGPDTAWHIREVGDDGTHYSGGITTPALCGRDLDGGWDVRNPVTPETARDPFVCRLCSGLLIVRVR